MELVNILWTGGWDSTFRVLILSEKKVTIQPYYYSFGRPSEILEINTVKKITDVIRNKKTTKCILKDLIVISNNDLNSNENEYKEAFNKLRKEEFIGSQYVKLAMLSRQLQGIELGIHRDDKAFKFINKYCSLRKVNDREIGEYYEIDAESSKNRDVSFLFENFRLPMLDLSKVEMKEISERNGFIDIMKMTIFCHHPIKGKPCGYCNPCIYTIKEGLKWRFDTMGLLRYYLLSGVKKLMGKR